ncbi:hypothetical protein [Rheinheimera hassiensis]|uniref:ParM/StbA family protein n=1 Tax=Rheinheimera hassiensis TaxID=1193627 RepID=UPI001F053684|nr:hypothetical protein [Rheinheimera hassiensis]
MNVRAIELGFGTTSLVRSVEKDGAPIITTYSSVVSQVDPKISDLSAGLNRRNTVQVQVENAFYEVGPDAGLVSDRSAGRILNNTYIDSHNYKALLLGSLYMMDCDEIDMLVLGVPVTSWNRVNELKKMVVGTHTISGRTIHVKDAWVIVQPMAGLLSYANSIGQKGYSQLRDMTVLSVDIGYGTADYLVSRGLKPNESRSGAVEAGMGTVIEQVSAGLKSAFPKLDRIPNDVIDAAFWKHPGTIRISGRAYPFPVCDGKDIDKRDVAVKFNVRPNIDQITRTAVTQIRNQAGSGADIDVILLFGGPATHYKEALSQAYPDHEIVMPTAGGQWDANSLTVVCEGLYWGGVQYAKRVKESVGAA